VCSSDLNNEITIQQLAFYFEKYCVEQLNNKSETKNSITKIEVKIRYNGKKWEVKFDGNGGFISAKKD
jgi:hypothetical protein